MSMLGAADARGIGGSKTGARVHKSASPSPSPSHSSEQTDSTEQSAAAVKRHWLTHIFEDPETEASHRAWQTQTKTKHLFNMFAVYLAHRLAMTWQSPPDLNDPTEWILCVGVFLSLLAGVFLAASLYSSSRGAKQWFYDAFVTAEITGEVLCVVLVSGLRGGTLPPSVYVVCATAGLTGETWMYHVTLTVMALALYYGAAFGVRGSPVDWGILSDHCKACLVLGVLSFVGDSSLRYESEARIHLLTFHNEISQIASNFSQSDQKNTKKSKDKKDADSKGSVEDQLNSLEIQPLAIVATVQQTLSQARRVSNMLLQAEARQAFFLATMSHELRSPLTAVLGCSDLLGGVQGLSSEAAEYVSLIQSSGAHLLMIVNDILDFSKLESGAEEFCLLPCVFDPQVLCQMALKMFEPQALSKSVKLELQVSQLQSVGMIRGDETRIEQILVNLLSNALKFTPRGGEVTLSITTRPVTGEEAGIAASLPGLLSGTESPEADTFEPYVLSISVADNGIGMSEATKQNMFKPFMQATHGARRQYQGTGLGLCIVKKIAAKMGCETIEVISEEGKGSTFKVDLIVERLKNSEKASWTSHQSREIPCSPTARSQHLATTAILLEEEKSDDGQDDDTSTDSASISYGDFDPGSGHTTDGEHCDATIATTTATATTTGAASESKIQLGSATAPANVVAEVDRPLEKWRILLVEDVKSIRTLGQRILSKQGARCSTAADGTLAVAAVEASIAKGKPFDCVLMDFHMPNMDGLTAIRKIREKHGDQAPKMIGFSADVMADTSTRFMEAGAVTVLCKPYNAKDLCHALRQHVKPWHGR